jgi:hypothetical protein
MHVGELLLLLIMQTPVHVSTSWSREMRWIAFFGVLVKSSGW